jgi:hypothetical protein
MIFTFIFFISRLCKIISANKTHDFTTQKNKINNQLTNVDTSFTGQNGIFKDEQDGKTYKWVCVGDQVWKAQYLAFKTNSGCSPFRYRLRQAEKKVYLYDLPTSMKLLLKDGISQH